MLAEFRDTVSWDTTQPAYHPISASSVAVKMQSGLFEFFAGAECATNHSIEIVGVPSRRAETGVAKLT